ncbi:MAG: alpha/beta fold hydrolase [Elusimicrobia bacterium]|nr:alpha/beta fold hydrolase [Elusimicrobiota bacterium]
MKIFNFFIISAFVCSYSFAEKVKIKTEDGCVIYGEKHIFSSSSTILLEIHGLGSNKEEWNKFNTFIKKEKINYLAVDLRGHGESIICEGQKIDYKSFSKEDWQKIPLDLDAAYSYLIKKYPDFNIIPAGASIGANAAAIFSKSKKISKLILLSPGYDYGGLMPEKYLSESKAKILFFYSPSDEYSAKSCSFFKKICDFKKLKCNFKTARYGHGVQIFDSAEGETYAEEIINFIKK